MVSFLDRTFCGSPNCVGKCGRQWTEKLAKQAVEWWGGDGAPVAFSNFCDQLETEEESRNKVKHSMMLGD